MPKWSIRVPSETADTYREFCDTEGISLQGALESSVRRTVQEFLNNERRKTDEWFPDKPPLRAAWMEYVRVARDLDAGKRARS